ncbi:MAG TPA: DinB family protein [Candidatus Dormibacteraeota bacterium]|nr:DinB family protein [Candidatus Dormibacteraeota bacterium]
MAEQLRYTDDDVMRLKDGAATVNALVRRTRRELLAERRFDEWSALEVIAHVVHLAEVTRERVERTAAEHDPRIESVPSGSLIEERDPVVLARRLQSAHARIVELLMEPGSAQRPATHPEWGRTNAGHFAAYHARHADGHIAELSRAFPPS